ncbi:hypothetical protein BDZ45DRAFT_799710 [Acephala macrosclerotiorum]|nr:hypothetical protein BDZ45DRAFT_799710 [Acephala macrosclerotiorum]
MSNLANNGSNACKRESKPKSFSVDLKLPFYSPTQTYLDKAQSHEETAIGYSNRSSIEAIRCHEERMKKEIQALATS